MLKTASSSFIKLVSILNDGQYHDGTSLGEKLNMTRSAVWKAIKKLISYDIKLDSIKGKGYALLEPLILLDANKIKRLLSNDKVTLNLFESIGSTNDFLKTLQHKPSKTTQICLAEQQTEGRGRLNRDWYSPFGKNIYISCLFPFQKDISALAGLSLVTSLAMWKTLNGFGITNNLYVKWPNDILHAGKKISGNLIEIQAETHGVCSAVIGMGINVNMLLDDQNISQTWTSMRKILGTYVDRNEVCARLIDNLVESLVTFENKGFATFADEWMAIDYLANQTVTLKCINEKVQGKMVGINEHGQLLLRLADGKIQAFSAGDTSIAKNA